jgi:hypothetical protein
VNTKIRLASCAALLAFSAGCGSSTTVVTVEPHPTIIEVNPREFAGSLKCGTGAGELQRYVATLKDITRTGDPDAGVPLNFELPSSAPARCEQGVAFGLVVAGHFYVAQIDGYDRSDLVQLAPGAPILTDPATQQPVAPRWTTTCGTPCPYKVGSGMEKLCPAAPEPAQPGLDKDDPYNSAVRAESELTQVMSPCWAWQNL